MSASHNSPVSQSMCSMLEGMSCNLFKLLSGDIYWNMTPVNVGYVTVRRSSASQHQKQSVICAIISFSFVGFCLDRSMRVSGLCWMLPKQHLINFVVTAVIFMVLKEYFTQKLLFSQYAVIRESQRIFLCMETFYFLSAVLKPEIYDDTLGHFQADLWCQNWIYLLRCRDFSSRVSADKTTFYW